MLFGMDRVGRGLHLFATLMVALGTLLSTFWILAANSWMQTPAGHLVNAAGQFVPGNWSAIIFNPSFPYRFVHMVLAAYLTTAFIVGGVGAWHLLRDQANAHARLMFSMAMWMAALVAPVQILAGDLHGLNTFEHQPAKIAALEGHFETMAGAPFLFFGIPDMAAETTRYQLAVPGLGSLLLTHEWQGVVRGLKDWPAQDRPNALILFFSFRIMVGIGFLMAGLGLFALWHRWRDTLYQSQILHWFAVAMAPSGFIAVLSGWITAEVGRQPYTVYGLLRTSESLSPVDAAAVSASLIAFILVYTAVFGAGGFYSLRLMLKRPEPHEPGLPRREPLRAAGIAPGPAQEGALQNGGGGDAR
jgi:cytochrome d ubiquinol oxidase subunit I